jgi:hypothetical protein
MNGALPVAGEPNTRRRARGQVEYVADEYLTITGLKPR